MFNQKIFAERLKSLREKLDLTHRDLEKETGVNYVSISRYENCKAIPGADAVGALADFFKVSSDYLMGMEKESFIEKNSYSHHTLSTLPKNVLTNQ